MEFAKKLWRDQSGNVESALVVIPLMALFLITVELIVTVNYRNVEQSYAQSSASSAAISSVVPYSDEVISLSSRPFSDELRLVVSHRKKVLPRLIPDFSYFAGMRSPITDVTGVAVMERTQH